jgi:hypothetical protein
MKYPFVQHRLYTILRVPFQVCIEVQETKYFIHIENNAYAKNNIVL